MHLNVMLYVQCLSCQVLGSSEYERASGVLRQSQQCKMNQYKKMSSVEHNRRMCFILETGLGGNDWTVDETKQ